MENSAKADVSLSNFVWNSPKNDPITAYAFGPGGEAHNYTGRADAIFVHYNDGRWVLSKIVTPMGSWDNVGIVATDTPPSEVSLAPAGTTGHYTNPFAYCKAAVNKDTEGEGGIIDSQYAGGNPPDVVVNKMGGACTWRCMDGAVYGCFLGASGRACMKPESSNSQRQILAMRQFCQQNPNSNVPNAVNNTASQWKCNGTIPVIDNAYPTAPVDKRGYYKDAWVKVSP
jgi:hypothetical protein